MIVPSYDPSLYVAQHPRLADGNDEITYNDLAHSYGMRESGTYIVVDESDYREIVYHGRLYICTLSYSGGFIIRRSLPILVDSLDFGMALVLPNRDAGFTQCLVTYVKKP